MSNLHDGNNVTGLAPDSEALNEPLPSVTERTAGVFREAGALTPALTPAEERDAFEAAMAADADRGATS